MSRSVSAPSSVTNTSPCWNGLIVPGSTLMYGSSLRLVTRMPREARMAARDAAAMPFPSEETTPPVTNTNLVMDDKFWKLAVYPKCLAETNSFHAVKQSSLRKAAHEARHGALAPDQRQHRVDRRRRRRPRHQHPQRQHHLRRLQLVPRERV